MSKPRDYSGKAPIFQKWDDKSFQYDTAHMHWLAQLLYRSLLQKAFHLSTRPDLPADDAQLQNILGVPADVWNEHKAAVRAMFTLDAAGLLWQKRLREDWRSLSIYRDQQTKRINARWAAAKEKKTQPVDTMVLPANYHGNTSRAEQSSKTENSYRQDDAVPSPAVGAATPSKGESTATPAGKKSAVELVTSFIYEATGCVPPDSSELQMLLQQFSAAEINRAVEEFVADQPKPKRVGALRTFFKDQNAAAIIEKNRRDDWLESVNNYTGRLDKDSLATFAAFKQEPIPFGIPDAEALLARATKAVENQKSATSANVQEVKGSA
jgi:uncharacterized protein YdaU (DUF1376 family)